MGSIREVVRGDGNRSFHAEVRLRGHSPQRASFRTRTLAKKWVQDTESSIRDGRHFKTVESKRHTVGEMIDRFVEQWLPKSPKSQAKQTALLMWWKKTCGHLLLSEFTPATIAECRDHLLGETTVRGQKRSTSTVNRYLSAIGKVLSIAVKEWGWLDDSPMRRVSKPEEAPGRERFLSLEERDRLLDECRKSRNANLYPMVALSLITGMRYGELSGLHWRDVDFEQRLITLGQTKNGDRRVIPLTVDSEAIFRNCLTFGRGADELVFQSQDRGRAGRRVSVREAFDRALKRANIQNFRWHDLRHTAASQMAMSGATQGELMAILGHRSPAMTRRYAHYSQQHLYELMQRTSLKLTLSYNQEGVCHGTTEQVST